MQMVNVPVTQLAMVEKVATLLAKPTRPGAYVSSMIPESKLSPLSTHIDKRALCAVTP